METGGLDIGGRLDESKEGTPCPAHGLFSFPPLGTPLQRVSATQAEDFESVAQLVELHHLGAARATNPEKFNLNPFGRDGIS